MTYQTAEFKTLIASRHSSNNVTAFLASSEPALSRITRRNVVVIDDEPSTVNLLRCYFQHYGISVRVFANPFDAVSWFETYGAIVDLVFLEMNNSHMDGEFCFALLQNIKSDVRVALMSGGPNRDMVQSLLDEGALCFFQKPFDYPAVIHWALNDGIRRH